MRDQIVRELTARFAAQAAPITVPNQIELAVPVRDLAEAVSAMLDGLGARGHLLTAYGCADDDDVTVRYVLDIDEDDVLFVLAGHCQRSAELASVAARHAAAAWPEREIAESFGLSFAGHPLGPATEATARPAVDGDGVSILTRGPLAAPLEEAYLLRAMVVGNHVVHASPQLEYKGRRAEDRARGMSGAHAAILAERLCGRCTLANATALAIALERLASAEPPARAVWLRTALVEIERLTAHAERIAELFEVTAWHSGGARARRASERIRDAGEELLGARSLRSLIAPGGLRRDLATPDRLCGTVRDAAAELHGVTHDALERPDLRDQLSDAGVIATAAARDFELTGPVSRASGIRRDARVAHHHLAYDELSIWSPVYSTGDALARLRVWQDEIERSAALIDELLTNLPAGPIHFDIGPLPASGRALAVIEAPAGTTVQAVHTDARGRIVRWHVRSASRANWPAVPLALADHQLDDVPIIERSFGFCVACADR